MLKGQKPIENPYNLPQQARDRYGAEFCNWFYEEWLQITGNLKRYDFSNVLIVPLTSDNTK